MKSITSKKEFEHVFFHAKRYRSSLVRLYIDTTPPGTDGKVSVVAAKRLGSAVSRNRSKRLLREAARLCNLPKEGYTMILFSTEKTKEASPIHIAKELSGLLRRARV